MKHSIKKVLNQIHNICIEKQLKYELSPSTFVIYVICSNGSFMYSAYYYYGSLYNKKSITSQTTLLLSDLLKKVKEL